MANVYVRSGATGAGTGADWANAYTTLAAAFSAKAAGDNFWISEDHAETQASEMILTSPGTPSNRCRVICVNHAGSVPPVSADLRTTAAISVTGFANSLFFDGYVSICRGIHFTVGGGGDNNCNLGLYDGNSTTQMHWVMDSCLLEIASTRSSSNALIQLGGNGGSVHEMHWTWIRTTVKFAQVGQMIEESI